MKRFLNVALVAWVFSTGYAVSAEEALSYAKGNGLRIAGMEDCPCAPIADGFSPLFDNLFGNWSSKLSCFSSVIRTPSCTTSSSLFGPSEVFIFSDLLERDRAIPEPEMHGHRGGTGRP